MKRCLIVRHGNTFRPGEIPRRVGGRTDLPLVEEERARAVGRYLSANGLRVDRIYAAPLLRTTRTAELIAEEARLSLPVIAEPRFTEIDYGPDENKTETDVKQRLGEEMARRAGMSSLPVAEVLSLGERVLDEWNTHAIVPPGWHVDVEGIARAWRCFASDIPDGENVLICTSNGIIRFAPLLLEDHAAFCREHNIKVSTGSLSIFRHDGERWLCDAWNIEPYRMSLDSSRPRG
ncbi:MAG: histidine phosphatase family protein [Odoribacteraceae bacterium]|jgi:probable phosphoglycerate mutase|nr:histidine phosphatase family protein [Odoribacteraceae bacterium]